MRFWDSSAVVPLLIEEQRSQQVRELIRADSQLVVWTLTPVECFSALFRRHRETPFTNAELGNFRTRLQALEKAWNEVINIELVKQRAERILGSHRLRAADALQLAAALIAFEDKPQGAQFVTFDESMATAAAIEGFTLI